MSFSENKKAICRATSQIYRIQVSLQNSRRRKPFLFYFSHVFSNHFKKRIRKNKFHFSNFNFKRHSITIPWWEEMSEKILIFELHYNLIFTMSQRFQFSEGNASDSSERRGSIYKLSLISNYLTRQTTTHLNAH